MKKNILIYFTITLLGIVTTSTSPLLLEFSKISQVPLSNMGIIFTANTFGFLFLSNFTGILAQAFKKKNLLVLILLLYSAFLLYLPYSSSLNQLLFKMFFIGGGTGSILSLLSAYTRFLNSKKPFFYLNLIHVYFGLGAILGPILINILIFYSLDWKLIYQLLSILTFLLCLLFSKSLGSEKIPEKGINWKEVEVLLKNKGIILLCICIALYNGAEVGVWGWLSTLLKDTKKTVYENNLLVSIFWAGMIIGRSILNLFLKKFSIRKILLHFLNFTVILSAVTIILNNYFNLKELFILLIGIGYSGLSPLMILYGFEINENKEYEYTLSPLLLSSGSFGIMIIPYLMGVSTRYVGTNLVSIIPILSLLLCTLIIYLVRNKDEKNKGQTSQFKAEL